MKSDTAALLGEYNNLIRETDKIYHRAAKSLGLSDCAFLILYALTENAVPLTQSNICDMMYQPKQTVNSAMKNLRECGYIELCEMCDRRSKEIRLTEKGKNFAENTVARIIDAEMRSFSLLGEEERDEFIAIFRKYTALLRENIDNEIKKKELP